MMKKKKKKKWPVMIVMAPSVTTLDPLDLDQRRWSISLVAARREEISARF